MKNLGVPGDGSGSKTRASRHLLCHRSASSIKKRDSSLTAP
jgi:hypothetical protein